MKKRFYTILFSLLATTVITLNVAPIELSNNSEDILQNNQTAEQREDNEFVPNISPCFILDVKHNG